VESSAFKNRQMGSGYNICPWCLPRSHLKNERLLYHVSAVLSRLSQKPRRRNGMYLWCFPQHRAQYPKEIREQSDKCPVASPWISTRQNQNLRNVRRMSAVRPAPPKNRILENNMSVAPSLCFEQSLKEASTCPACRVTSPDRLSKDERLNYVLCPFVCLPAHSINNLKNNPDRTDVWWRLIFKRDRIRAMRLRRGAFPLSTKTLYITTHV
jgi:hypothetical protein